MTDIFPSEKHFMTLWNKFIRNLPNPIISENQLSSILLLFTEKNSKYIHEYNLKKEFTFHVTNLWLEGQIGRETLLNSMIRYNANIDGVKK